jgi:hypothetical protein
MQFSNRRQTGGLAIASLISIEKIRRGGPLPGHLPAHHSSLSIRHIARHLSTLAFRRAGCYFVGAPSNQANTTESGEMKPARIA